MIEYSASVLLLSVAFAVFSYGLSILAHAAVNFFSYLLQQKR